MLELGNCMSGTEYQQLLLRRMDFRGRVEAVLDEVDLLITSVLAFTTPAVQQTQRMNEKMISSVHRFTCPSP